MKQNSAMTHLCNSCKVPKETFLSQLTKSSFTNLIPVVPDIREHL